jgi:DNA invertase Pin-like site-specific DNA recombinase
VLEQPIDTTSAAGRLFFTILASFCEFEASIRAERQKDGIDAVKGRPGSPFKGRPASINGNRVVELRAQGLSPSRIARDLGIARSSVYRYLNEA